MTGADKVTFGLSLTPEARREAEVTLATIILAAWEMEYDQWD